VRKRSNGLILLDATESPVLQHPLRRLQAHVDHLRRCLSVPALEPQSSSRSLMIVSKASSVSGAGVVGAQLTPLVRDLVAPVLDGFELVPRDVGRLAGIAQA